MSLPPVDCMTLWFLCMSAHSDGQHCVLSFVFTFCVSFNGVRCNFHIKTMFISSFQLFNWFQLFSSGEKLLKVAGHSQNRSFERGYRWFQLFFIDFQLFCFLTIIIPETCSWIIDIWWYVSEQEGTNTQEEINKQCTDGETTFILCDVTKDQQVKVCEQTKGIFLW
jgi:hypothetical protein